MIRTIHSGLFHVKIFWPELVHIKILNYCRRQKQMRKSIFWITFNRNKLPVWGFQYREGQSLRHKTWQKFRWSYIDFSKSHYEDIWWTTFRNLSSAKMKSKQTCLIETLVLFWSTQGRTHWLVPQWSYEHSFENIDLNYLSLGSYQNMLKS